MIKNQYSQDTNQPFLLVKGLVDDRKKVNFLKPPLIRQQTGVYKDGSTVQGSEKKTQLTPAVCFV